MPKFKPGSCILFKRAGQWQFVCVCVKSQCQICVIRIGLSAAGECEVLIGVAFNAAL